MASVLKPEAMSRGTDYPRPALFNVEDVQARARDYLAEVQREAQQIIDNARKQAERMQAQARLDGLAQAANEVRSKIESEARQLSDARCKTAIAACEKSVQELAQSTTEWLAKWRNQTVEIAARMAEKVVRRELTDNRETLRMWLEEALATMRDAREVRVLVHPDDFSVAGSFLEQLSKSMPQTAGVEILPDSNISPGGCLVRSTHGELDQQLETQLQRLVEQLA